MQYHVELTWVIYCLIKYNYRWLIVFLSRTGLQPDLRFSSSSYNENHSNNLFDLPPEFESD